MVHCLLNAGLGWRGPDAAVRFEMAEHLGNRLVPQTPTAEELEGHCSHSECHAPLELPHHAVG